MCTKLRPVEKNNRKKESARKEGMKCVAPVVDVLLWEGQLRLSGKMKVVLGLVTFHLDWNDDWVRHLWSTSRYIN